METNTKETDNSTELKGQPMDDLLKKSWFSKHQVYGYLFLLIIFVIAVSAIYYAQIKDDNLNILALFINTKNHHAQTVSTVDWKTYRNTEYGFEFNYPGNWYIFINPDFIKDGDIVYAQTSSKEISLGGSVPEGWKEGIDYVTSGQIFSVSREDYLEPEFSINGVRAYINKRYSNPELMYLKEIKINGLGGWQFAFKNEIGEGEPTAVFYKDGIIYSISYISSLSDKEENGYKLFNQILSTFKFIEPAKPVTKGASVSAPVSVPKSVTMDDFAKCLSAKNAVMYGASWCSHCQNEKKAFGSSWQYVHYVECAENPQVCLDAGVQGFPTWVLSGDQKFPGEQNRDGFKKLSEATSCQLPAK
jgi:hypothetical protein